MLQRSMIPVSPSSSTAAPVPRAAVRMVADSLSSPADSAEGRLRVAIVVPARNESFTIGSVLRAVPKNTPQLEYRVFVCDDGSSDSTGSIARECGATVTRHASSLGIGSALTSGFQAARAWSPDVIVQMDSDGQHDPGLIPTLLDPILRGNADYVIGSRFLTGGGGLSPVRRVGVSFYTRLIRLLGGIRITDVTSGFRAFRADAYDRLSFRARMNWAVEATLRAGLGHVRTVEVSTPHRPRGGGRSQFHQRRMFVLYHFRAAVEIIWACAESAADATPLPPPRFLLLKRPASVDVPSSSVPTSSSSIALDPDPVDRTTRPGISVSMAPTGPHDGPGPTPPEP